MTTRGIKKNRVRETEDAYERFSETPLDALKQTADGVMITNQDGAITFANAAIEQLTGYSFFELVGKNPRIFQSGHHPKSFYDKMWRTLLAGKSFRAVFLNRNKSGGLFYVDQTITPIRHNNHGNVYYVTIWKEVTAQKKSEDEVRRLAYHDFVTRLPNRILLHDRLQQAISNAKRYGRHLALLFIDLDKFKDVNDSLGHSAGDALLREAGQRIMGTLRETDTVSRIGGDEFAVLLSGVETDMDAVRIAGIILEELQAGFDLGEAVVSISASIGIAVFPQHGLSAEQLLKRADRAMYATKKAGGNNYQLDTGEINL